ncbi:MAG TPA: phosphoadenosine phosphosulfate reductase family protein [Methanoregulaceae archaeon]|nr:phosphoadenosine phosphosulfate reductase family protein [Methanoregulaceae archaeon]
MRPSYLGKILLRWCDTCHVPVLSRLCSCGSETREVPLTPPGDARPAFSRDITWINTVFQDHFGAPLVPEGHLCLLNKVPDKDRMDEIIIGGGIAGSIRYIPESRTYEPIPRPEAGVLIRPKKRYVVVDDGAAPFIREGASVLAPGLLEIDDAVKEGDEVLIFTRDRVCIGAGRAKVPAEIARTMEKGQVIRVRKNIPSQIIPSPATWEDAVSSNSKVLKQVEEDSVGFVREVKERTPLPATVSFSGGKDSLATLLVVKKALGKVPLLFADTGMEFPETYENVRAVADEFGLDVVATDCPDRFWEQFWQRGPPAVNARWCCKVCKLDPLSALICSQWGECLSFVGQRKYESQIRAQSRRVWKNPNVPSQLCAAPIHNWTALHVWLYIMREHAPYNQLYEQGLDRIGCFMCPASDLALIHRIESDHPDLWGGWMTHLTEWQEKNALPDNWASSGRWRIRGVSGSEDDRNC